VGRLRVSGGARGLACSYLLFTYFLAVEPGSILEFIAIPLVYCSMLFVPLSIGIAILRYRLWDIDLIIRRSLVIGPLATMLTVVFELANQLLLLFVFRFIPVLDDSSSIETVASVLIVVAVFKPLHARLDANVNRLVDWHVGADRISESLRRRISSDARCSGLAMQDALVSLYRTFSG